MGRRRRRCHGGEAEATNAGAAEGEPIERRVVAGARTMSGMRPEFSGRGGTSGARGRRGARL
jgi:hypothetical protein